MRFTFRFRPIPFIAALLAFLVGLSLGQWQLRRAAEKEAIEERMSVREKEPALRLSTLPADPAALEFRSIVLSGQFDAAWPLYLDNRPYKGSPGFTMLMPLKIAGSDMHIMVERGWLPRNVTDRMRIPAIPVPAGQIAIEGRVRRDAGRVLQLGDAPKPTPGAILQNLDIDAFARASGLKLAPYVLEQTSASGDGLVRDWPRPSTGRDKHYGYAFQWFALAATAIIFFLVTGFRRGTTS